MTVIKAKGATRYTINPSFSDEEIEQDRLEKLNKLESDHQEELSDLKEDFEEEKVFSPEKYEKMTFEDFCKERNFKKLDPSNPDPYSLYHSVGAIEMVMSMTEKLLDDYIIIGNSDYYNQAYKAFNILFDLAQMTALDWFDKKDK